MSDTTKRYIGIVKFHDYKKGKFGFINNPEVGEIYFNERNISQEFPYQSSIEKKIVVFSISESNRKDKKLEAIHIKTISEENNWNFIISYFLSKLSSSTNYSADTLLSKNLLSEIENYNIWNRAKDGTSLYCHLYFDYLDSIFVSILSDTKSLINLLNIGKKLFGNIPEKIESYYLSSLPITLISEFWGKKILTEVSIEIIFQIYSHGDNNEKIEVLSKCSDFQLEQILEKIVYSINNEQQLLSIKEYLQFIKDKLGSFNKQIENHLFNICADSSKLDLWINEYIERLDFFLYKQYLAKESFEKQKIFIRKVLSYIESNKVSVSLDEILSLLEVSKLDISIKTLLFVISKLKNANIFNSKEIEESMYGLIFNHFNQYNMDLKYISDFFAKCEGRCSAQKISENNYRLNRNIQVKPKFRFICDGRKAYNGKTGEAILSTVEKLEFWWCENYPCFSPSRIRKENTQRDWNDYNIHDFLFILKVHYSDIHLEIILNLINKINRFIEHLKCRNCGCLLLPRGRSNYAFHGLSLFYCGNKSCEESEMNVYLSHCLNGRCEMIIDSRDSVKCENGWYICNYCLACCNSNSLQKRKLVTETINNNEYKGTIIGHKDLKIISCPKCSKTISVLKLKEEHQRVLKWLIEHADSSNRISTSGTRRRDGKKWFVIKRNNDTKEQFEVLIEKFRKVGFEAPSFEKNVVKQLIVEPKELMNLLRCDNCHYKLEFDKIDKEQKIAIEKYHFSKPISFL